jgi:2OG-Fe(II) oxygenase superfamily
MEDRPRRRFLAIDGSLAADPSRRKGARVSRRGSACTTLVPGLDSRRAAPLQTTTLISVARRSIACPLRWSLSLFAPPALDVHYFPDALPDADAVLSYLTTQITWLDRMASRRTASFGLPYDYSGQRYDPIPMPPPIAALADRAATRAGHAFNNCLCNLYETGLQTMGFHQDSYDGLVPTSHIAIVSLGATRVLHFRSLDQRHRAARPLAHGSILLMSAATQGSWKHAVPRDRSAGLRVSATFRQLAG